jgi:TPR repeat protein
MATLAYKNFWKSSDGAQAFTLRLIIPLFFGLPRLPTMLALIVRFLCAGAWARSDAGLTPRLVVQILAAMTLAWALAAGSPALADLAAGRAALASGDEVAAFKHFMKASEAGDIMGDYLAGGMLMQGKGAPRDFIRGLSLMEKAARAGHVGAQSAVGALYAFGQEMPADYAKALTYLRPAAEAGDAHAQNNLAALLYFGLGGARDMTAALYWAKRAADQGLIAALRLAADIETAASAEEKRNAALRLDAAKEQSTRPSSLAAPSTRSLPPLAPSPPLATAKAERDKAQAGAWVVQIASLPHPDEARRHWVALQQRLPALLGAARALFETATIQGKGDYTRVLIEAGDSRAKAQDLCVRLRAARLDCLIRTRPL